MFQTKSCHRMLRIWWCAFYFLCHSYILHFLQKLRHVCEFTLLRWIRWVRGHREKRHSDCFPEIFSFPSLSVFLDARSTVTRGRRDAVPGSKDPTNFLPLNASLPVLCLKCQTTTWIFGVRPQALAFYVIRWRRQKVALQYSERIPRNRKRQRKKIFEGRVIWNMGLL